MAVKRGYSPRKLGTILDLLHIIIGIIVVVLAFFAFVSPDRYIFLFPLIFLLAAFLNVLTGWLYLKMYPRVKKKKASGMGYIIIGLVIMVLFVISAISIWGNA